MATRSCSGTCECYPGRKDLDDTLYQVVLYQGAHFFASVVFSDFSGPLFIRMHGACWSSARAAKTRAVRLSVSSRPDQAYDTAHLASHSQEQPANRSCGQRAPPLPPPTLPRPALPAHPSCNQPAARAAVLLRAPPHHGRNTKGRARASTRQGDTKGHRQRHTARTPCCAQRSPLHRWTFASLGSPRIVSQSACACRVLVHAHVTASSMLHRHLSPDPRPPATIPELTVCAPPALGCESRLRRISLIKFGMTISLVCLLLYVEREKNQSSTKISTLPSVESQKGVRETSNRVTKA